MRPAATLIIKDTNEKRSQLEVSPLDICRYVECTVLASALIAVPGKTVCIFVPALGGGFEDIAQLYDEPVK